ncbi:MAG: recombinase zinc beta ribbon domain-containing protein [Clostridia bacterium]|nr:recombinase zinc beta ribbon domain-containing protein [Clostridia bacterium]
MLHVNHYDTEGHKAARQQGRSASLRLRPEEEWIAVPIPALIGREEWERLQQALAARRRGNQGGRIYEYHLSGLVYCGCCSARMAGGYGKSSSGRVYRYYIYTRAWPSVHAGRAHLEPCPGNRHRADGVEEAVWARVREWLADPEELAKAARDGEQMRHGRKSAAKVINGSRFGFVFLLPGG